MKRPPNINETEGKIYPASKRVAFNPSLTFNDGLLINSISFSEKISYNEASDLVKKLLEQWKKKLSDKESLLLVGIGELTLNEDQKLIFAPLLSNNFHPDSFGLSELEIKPVIRKLAELTSVENELSYRVIEPEEETFEVKHHHKTNKSRKVLYYSLTAYIPIIIGLWAVCFLPILSTIVTKAASTRLKQNENRQAKHLLNLKNRQLKKQPNPKKLNRHKMSPRHLWII